MKPLRLLSVQSTIAVLLFGAQACGTIDTLSSLDTTDSVSDLTIQNNVKTYIASNLQAMVDHATALQKAAPDSVSTGWASTDVTVLEPMQAEWKKIRVAYESIEGAIAVLFPDFDASTDERYDGFIEGEADTNLFDDEIVTGVHGIERILWSPSIPDHVVQFESALPNYEPARYPQNETEATDFRESLVQRLIDDSQTMLDAFEPLALDNATAFRGVIGSLEEQLEKIDLASTGEDESRYAQHTLADMQANLAGGKRVYLAFQPRLVAQGYADLDQQIMDGFTVLEDAYAAIGMEGLPPVPASWDSENPSTADLASDFGQLFQIVSAQADPEADNSLVSYMLQAADHLGIPQLPE